MEKKEVNELVINRLKK